MGELFQKVQNLIVSTEDIVGGKEKRKPIGSAAFISFFNTFCCWFSPLHTEEPNTYADTFSCPHWESPTFCAAAPQGDTNHTVWGGSEAVVGQLNINEWQGEGELFFIFAVNTAEQSREVSCIITFISTWLKWKISHPQPLKKSRMLAARKKVNELLNINIYIKKKKRNSSPTASTHPVL